MLTKDNKADIRATLKWIIEDDDRFWEHLHNALDHVVDDAAKRVPFKLTGAPDEDPAGEEAYEAVYDYVAELLDRLEDE